MVSSIEGSGGGREDKGDKKMRGETQGSVSERGVQVDPRIQSEIGKHLRAIYDDVINEPVPSKFMELLEKLEQSTRKG